MKIKASNGLTLVVPVYNEHNGIEPALEQLRKIWDNVDFDLEIILVNDGSDDGTEEILNGLSDKRFVVINHPKNRGYGAALKTGIKASTSPYVAITDADGTYPNDRLGEFYHEIIKRDLDMLVGARVGENVKIPLIRKPAKWVLNKIANYLSGAKIPDLNSGFRIMKREVLEKFLNILPDGFSFTTTITLGMLTNGFAVEYVSIDYDTREGKSKIRPIYDTLNFLQLIIRTTLYFDPLRVFVPLSGLFLLVSFLLVLARIILGSGFGVISVIFFVLGIQFLAIGMLADLIDKRFTNNL